MTQQLTTILNPHSGDFRKFGGGLIRQIRNHGEDLGPVIVTETPKQVDRILEDTPLDSIVEVLGGDGAIHGVLTAAARTNRHHMQHWSGGGTYKLAPNYIASQSGISLPSVVEGYSAFTDHLRKGVLLQTFDFPILNVDKDGSVLQGGVFGAAVLARFLNEYHERGHNPSVLRRLLGMESYGPLSAVELILDGAVHPSYAKSFLEPVDAMIMADGKQLPLDKYNVALISSYPFSLNLGADIRPFRKLTPDLVGKQFEIIVGEISIPWFGLNFFPSALGFGWWMPQLDSYLAEEVEIYTDRNDLCTVDGDTYAQPQSTKISFGTPKKVYQAVDGKK